MCPNEVSCDQLFSSPNLPPIRDEGDVQELLSVPDVAERPRHVRLEVVPPQAVLLGLGLGIS